MTTTDDYDRPSSLGPVPQPAPLAPVARPTGTAETYPTLVTLVLVLLGISALAALLAGLGYLAIGLEAIGMTLVLGAAAHGAAVWGVVARMAWGWWLAAIAAGVGVLVNVLGLYTGDVPTFLFGLILAVAILALLATRQVRDWAGVDLAMPGEPGGRPA